MASSMKVSTPELLWHGGGAENGKPDPVFSVDMFDTNILATAGVDENIPPKGSMRLWKIGETDANLQFLVDLNDHGSTINVVRFSPCGKMIATASDRQIIIYSLLNPDESNTQTGGTVPSWGELTDPKQVTRLWLRPCLQEIYDLQWSPDSLYVVAGSIDSKGEILKVLTRDTISLRGHSSYVQGVAWDPLNQMVVTQSADRSCRIHQLKHKYKAAHMAKIITKGNQQIRMTNPHGAALSTIADTTPPSFSTSLEDPSAAKNVTTASSVHHLFADSTVPCFFRRPSFSPDGSLLITPTGIYRPSGDSAAGGAEGTTEGTESGPGPSFCTHVFLRDHLQSPILSLVGLEDPSVGVRCCPLLYQLMSRPPRDGKGEEEKDEESAPKPTQESLFGGGYRMIFAVVTTSSVLLYDTQHVHPIARIGGCHLATINDAAWSKDGRTLVFCSSDGYLTFVRFEDDALGPILPRESVPLEVKQAFPYVYDYEYIPPVSKQQLQQQQKQKQESVEGTSVTDSKPTQVLPPTVPITEAAPDSSANDTSGAPSTTSKKKRRIAPMNISPLTAAAGGGGGESSPFNEQKTFSSNNKVDASLLFSTPNSSVSSPGSSGPPSEDSPLANANAAVNVSSPQTGAVSSSGTCTGAATKTVGLPIPPVSGVAVAAKKTKKRIAPTLLNAL